MTPIRPLDRRSAAADGPLDLHVKIHPGIPVVAEISGEVDIVSASWLRETLLLAIYRHGAAICVDLQGVTFLDCSGVNVLLATARRALLEGGRMRLARPPAQVWRVITLLGLQGMLVKEDETSYA
jgi:anti-anti-sigma factor